MELIAAAGKGPLAVDTAIFIYWIEEHPRWVTLLDELFRAADSGKLALVTSAVTLLEVLVVPYRAGDIFLAERYEALLTRGRGLRLVDLDRAQLRAAAQLRAVRPALKTPDALQVAAALAAGCTALLTNDRDIPSVAGLRILQLASFDPVRPGRT